MSNNNEYANKLFDDFKRELRQSDVIPSGLMSFNSLNYKQLEDIFEKNKVLTMYIQARDWFEIIALIKNGFTDPKVTNCFHKLEIQYSLDQLNENVITLMCGKYQQCYVYRKKEDIANRFKTDINAVKPMISQVFENVQSSSLDYFWFNQARNAFNQAFLFAMKCTYEDPDPI